MPFSKAKQLLEISIFRVLCLIAKNSSAVQCKGGLSAFNYHYAHELTQTDLWERDYIRKLLDVRSGVLLI